MALTLDKLVFDPSSTADGGSVGAYLRASDGTLLTHTDVGGKKALDVRLAEGVNVEVDLAHTDDSVRLGDGTSFFTSTSENSDVALDVHISNTSLAVTATDLDIRNLVFATDKVDVSGSSVTVTATDLDIRNLIHTQDSIKIGDGTDFLAINTDGSINVAAAAGTAATYGNKTITTTATKVITTNLANRRKVIVQNLGIKDVFFGHDASVTTALGVKVSAGSSIELEFGATLDCYAITASSTADVRYLEVA
jgi:hypothetical protein